MINLQNRFSKRRLHTALFLALPFGSLQGAEDNRLAWLDDYNVVWTTPSVNSAASMPCGGGYTSLNVWVENGDLLFYLQRSGSLAETGEHLTLDPNPFLRFPNIRTSGEHTHPSTQAIEGNPKTKWFVLKNQSAWARIDLGPDGAAADFYILTSADDRPGRALRDWTLSGSNDGTSWTRLSSEKDQDFPNRFQACSFAIPEPGRFRFYRFEFANDGDPDFQLGEDGKLVIYPSNSCESYHGAKNPTDLIAEIEGDRIMEPAESWKSYINEECPRFYPLFAFNRFDLLGMDRDQLKLFPDTWKNGTFSKSMVGSWHQDGIFFVRMGMTADAADFNTRKLDDAPRRFPTFWRPGHDWVPDHNWGGSGMLGLQEMLMLTVGDEILLFEAGAGRPKPEPTGPAADQKADSAMLHRPLGGALPVPTITAHTSPISGYWLTSL